MDFEMDPAPDPLLQAEEVYVYYLMIKLRR